MGAGRGPLVRAALSAARQTERRLKVYAIEKNANAVVTLHKLVAAERSSSYQNHPVVLSEADSAYSCSYAGLRVTPHSLLVLELQNGWSIEAIRCLVLCFLHRKHFTKYWP